MNVFLTDAAFLQESKQFYTHEQRHVFFQFVYERYNLCKESKQAILKDIRQNRKAWQKMISHYARKENIKEYAYGSLLQSISERYMDAYGYEERELAFFQYLFCNILADQIDVNYEFKHKQCFLYGLYLGKDVQKAMLERYSPKYYKTNLYKIYKMLYDNEDRRIEKVFMHTFLKDFNYEDTCIQPVYLFTLDHLEDIHLYIKKYLEDETMSLDRTFIETMYDSLKL